MACFPLMFRWAKSFSRPGEPIRIIEIGPPTNFRKEEFVISLNEKDALTSCDSHGSMEEENIEKAALNPSKRKWFVTRARLIRSRVFQ